MRFIRTVSAVFLVMAFAVSAHAGPKYKKFTEEEIKKCLKQRWL